MHQASRKKILNTYLRKKYARKAQITRREIIFVGPKNKGQGFLAFALKL